MGIETILCRNIPAPRLAALFLLAAALAGCASPPCTTLREFVLGDAEFVATDLRLRVITNSNADPARIVCTEPSPDVAVTLANSFAAGVSVPGDGTGSLSGSAVEGLVSVVERTASIQLLRDKMYQTCLAYANGAISATTYGLLMSRLDDTIITLLLGETGGGIDPPPTKAQ